MRPGPLTRWTLGLALASATASAQEPAPSSAPPTPAAAEPTPAEPTPADPTSVEPAPVDPPAEPTRPRPTAAPAPPPLAPAEKPLPVSPPFASDTLAGQFQLGVRGLFSVPTGELAYHVDAFSNTDVGYGGGVDLGIGIARHVVVGAYGEAILHGAASGCTDCSSTELAAGAFVRYHLVQGLRFDPWVSYGIGYRGLAITSPTSDTRDYAGLEWMRLTFAGDWYAAKQFGFGPFVELDAASYMNVPGNEETAGITWRLQSGLRILLDLPGR